MNALEIVRKAAGAAIAVDSENRILGLNRGARKLLGFDARRARGKNFHELVEARDAYGNRLATGPGAILEMVGHGEAVKSFEVQAKTASNEIVRLAVGVIVVLGPEPEELNMVFQLRPVLRRRKADEAIERILSTGGLGEVDPKDLRGKLNRAERAGLTRRQFEVLGLIVEGATVEEMAKTLGVSVHTVRTHVARILKRLNVRSRVEAVSVAFRKRLV